MKTGRVFHVEQMREMSAEGNAGPHFVGINSGSCKTVKVFHVEHFRQTFARRQPSLTCHKYG